MTRKSRHDYRTHSFLSRGFVCCINRARRCNYYDDNADVIRERNRHVLACCNWFLE
jgi:hypothetical protein